MEMFFPLIVTAVICFALANHPIAAAQKRARSAVLAQTAGIAFLKAK